MGLSELFISVESLPENGYGLFQLIFLGAVYGYFLTFASNLISDGSELLLLVPAWAGLIGSVVLPVLGAVPDGCIVLFSGMGPNAQEQLNVGVGALAGSTIMLLTIPWFLSIMGGRVNVDPATGKASYKSPKLVPEDNFSLTETGVTVSRSVNQGAYVMLLTSISYLVLQVPGLQYLNNSLEEQAAGEKHWAQLGAALCIIFFFGYLYQQYKISQESHTLMQAREEYVRNAIMTKKVTLAGVMIAELAEYKLIHPKYSSSAAYQQHASESQHLLGGKTQSRLAPDIPPEFIAHLERILKPFFKFFDEDGNGTLSVQELVAVFREMGEELSAEDVTTLFDEFDKDRSGTIDYSEFVAGVVKYICEHQELRHRHMLLRRSHSSQAERTRVVQMIKDGAESQDEDDAGDEDEEMPEDIRRMSPEDQQKRIKSRAAIMMGLGTLIVLLVSDPMVDVMSELGKRTGIPAFYIAFVMAPLASNASELIAAYNYSLKKTTASIAISMATLEGACIMNNTFVLGIFMLLICTQSLVWEFFAETATILFVQLVMAYFAFKQTHTLRDGFLILSLYPLSLAMVALLEANGWN